MRPRLGTKRTEETHIVDRRTNKNSKKINACIQKCKQIVNRTEFLSREKFGERNYILNSTDMIFRRAETNAENNSLRQLTNMMMMAREDEHNKSKFVTQCERNFERRKVAWKRYCLLITNVFEACYNWREEEEELYKMFCQKTRDDTFKKSIKQNEQQQRRRVASSLRTSSFLRKAEGDKIVVVKLNRSTFYQLSTNWYM